MSTKAAYKELQLKKGLEIKQDGNKQESGKISTNRFTQENLPINHRKKGKRHMQKSFLVKQIKTQYKLRYLIIKKIMNFSKIILILKLQLTAIIKF